MVSDTQRVSEPKIRAFWTWWLEHRASIAAARVGGDHAYRHEVAQAVAQLHPKLGWDVTPGRVANAALCFTSLGDPAVRRAAVTVADAAPPADADWEVHAHRIAVSGDPGAIVLRADRREIAFSQARVAVRPVDASEQIDLDVWHPALAGWHDKARQLTLHQLLDVTLGEDGVGRWVRRAALVDAAPLLSCSLLQLRQVVAHLATVATGDRWTLLHGALPDDKPVLATVNLAVKAWDYPLLDSHVEIAVPVLRPDARGLPGRDELLWLNQRSDELAYYLGAQAVVVARETGDALRVLHLYADAAGPAREMVARWADKQRDREVRVSWAYDPCWAVRERWREQPIQAAGA